MGRSVSLWHSTCSSHTANLLAKDVVDKDINKQIVSILKEFKIVDLEALLIKEGGTKVVLPIDIRWCIYRNSYVSFIKNLPFMKRVSCDHSQKVKPAIQKLLFDSEFVTKATEFIDLFDPMCTLINKCQNSETSIADAVDLWLNLSTPANFPHFQLGIDSRREMALNVYALAAYTLHPIYSELASIKLSDSQQRMVQDFLISELSANALEELMQFQEKRGFFLPNCMKKIFRVQLYFGMLQECIIVN